MSSETTPEQPDYLLEYTKLRGEHEVEVRFKVTSRCERLVQLIDMRAPTLVVHKEAAMVFDSLLAYFGADVLMAKSVTRAVEENKPVQLTEEQTEIDAEIDADDDEDDDGEDFPIPYKPDITN